MEVKVFVDGFPRVVCGLTKATTCQEVVIALAQALGQPGRYLLLEKYKDFQRCMAPGEHVLETLERYGELARDVQLTLILNGPAGHDPMSRRYQPLLPLRKKGLGGGRLWRGSSSLHRQSLPPVTEQLAENVKRTKRKSLSIMEEAWEWLENLGKGKVYKTTSDRDLCRKSEKKNRMSLEVTLPFCKESVGRNSKVKVHSDKVARSDLDNQTSCCIRSQPKTREYWCSEAKIQELTSLVTEDEKKRLIENIISQQESLKDLKMQIAVVDRQIFDIEELQRLQKSEEEAVTKAMEEELEQIMFWENELRAEEGHERDLQDQFLEMKDRVMDCKAELEELKAKMQGFDFGGTQTLITPTNCTNDVESTKEQHTLGELCGRMSPNRKSQPREHSCPPHALVAPSQIKERRSTGPAELREWWARWAQAQRTPVQRKVTHRSELTVYLRSTKV